MSLRHRYGFENRLPYVTKGQQLYWKTNWVVRKERGKAKLFSIQLRDNHWASKGFYLRACMRLSHQLNYNKVEILFANNFHYCSHELQQKSFATFVQQSELFWTIIAMRLPCVNHYQLVQENTGFIILESLAFLWKQAVFCSIQKNTDYKISSIKKLINHLRSIFHSRQSHQMLID